MNRMKSRKRWASMLICTVIALSTAACDQGKTPSGGSSAAKFNPYSYNLTLTMPGQSGVVFLGAKSANIHLKIVNIGRYRGKDCAVKFTFTSVYGGDPQTVTKTYDETAKSDTLTEFDVPINTQSLGYWQVDADIAVDGNKVNTVSKGYTVVNTPQNYGQKDPDGFFGSMGAVDYATAQSVGVKWERPCAYWRFIRGADGQNHWEGLDQTIDGLLAANCSIVLCVQPEVDLNGVTLPGMTINKPDDLTRSDVLEEYKKFLTEAVQRYKDKVYAFEIINEPDIDFTLHSNMTSEATGQLVATVMEESYQTIKKIAPNMPVMGLSMSDREYYQASGGQKSVTQWIFDIAKGAKLCDIASLHPYPFHASITSNSYSSTSPEQLYDYISNGIKYMKDNGVNQIMVTETGYSVPDSDPLLSDSRKLQAAYNARCLIISKSFPQLSGALIFGFNYGDEDGTCMGMFGPKIQDTADGDTYYPFVSAAAYAQTTHALYHMTADAPISVGFITGVQGVGAYPFHSATQSLVVVWKDRSTQQITLSGVPSLQAQDIFGNTVGSGDVTIAIGDNPIYLFANVSDGAKLTQAVKTALSVK